LNQNNYVELKYNEQQILTSNQLECLNYFDGLAKLFSDHYLVKFLDMSAKSSFRVRLQFFCFLFCF